MVTAPRRFCNRCTGARGGTYPCQSSQRDYTSSVVQGHRWPYLLIPLYAVLKQLPATRDSALRLGLVTLPQMVAALARAVERPPEGVSGQAPRCEAGRDTGVRAFHANGRAGKVQRSGGELPGGAGFIMLLPPERQTRRLGSPRTNQSCSECLRGAEPGTKCHPSFSSSLHPSPEAWSSEAPTSET